MTDKRINVAAVQMVSSDAIDENLTVAGQLITQAARQDATVVVLPENFSFMGRDDDDRLALAEPDTPDATVQAFLAAQAKQHKIWLIGGTIPIMSLHAKRVYSACLCFAPDGRYVARYDKIHLFDVDLPGAGRYHESGSTVPGSRAVVASTPFGGIGMAVCYDLRFPELFRAMAGPELSLFTVSSAFTRPTGAAHWETLVRARAIENLTAVVAASQGGDHTGGRQTWGHSMIVDAWGKVLAQKNTGAGVIVAEIDIEAQNKLRAGFPVLLHRKTHITKAEEKTDDS